MTRIGSAAATAPPNGSAGLTHRTLAGLAWTAGGKAVYAGLRLLVLFILARLVAPADFGVVGAAAVVMGFSTIFSQLGMAPAIVQRPVLERRHEQAAFSASVGLGLMLGVLLWLLAPTIAAGFRIPAVQPVLRTFAWTFPLAGLSVVGDAMMQRELRFKWLATVEVVSFVVGYGVVGVTLALLRAGVWALVAAEMSKVALYSTILLLTRPQPFTLRPERRAFAELMYYGSGFTVSKIANYLALQLDNVIVGRWLGAAALGFYGRAYELMAAAPALLGEPVDKVLFPAMAARQGDLRSLASAYQRGIAAMALITLPLSTIVCALAPEAIAVLLGPKWTPVVVPFQILTLGMFLRTSYRISDVVARATGAVYRRAWRQTVYMLCVVVGAWFGRRLGIAGVALGVLGALAVNYLLMNQLGLRLAHLSWRRFWRAHLSALLTAGLAGAATWGLAALLRSRSVPPAAILAIVLIVDLGAALLLIRTAPRLLLGADGEWMLHRLLESVPWRPASRAAPPPAADSSTVAEPLHPGARRIPARPVVVELVGPAGVGKSTVADELAGRDDTRRVSVWGLPLRLVSRSAVRLVPTFLQVCFDSRALPWREMKYMIRLGALHQLLSQGTVQRHRLIVLDEGPAFVLSWLRVFGAERLLRSAAYERWVQRTLTAWVRLLDVVVSLDAPDAVLAQRIRSRAKPHLIRHQSDQQIAAFTARFRTAFASVIPALASLNGTRQVALPAGAQDPQAVAARVLQGIEGLLA